MLFDLQIALGPRHRYRALCLMALKQTNSANWELRNKHHHIVQCLLHCGGCWVMPSMLQQHFSMRKKGQMQKPH